MSNFKTIRVKLKPTQVTLENENRNKSKFKVGISVSEQDYDYLPKKWSYGKELNYGVKVDVNVGDTEKKVDYYVSVEKGFFTNNLVLTRDLYLSNVLERPTIGIVSYRWGVITGWVVGIGLAIAGIIVFVKHRKNKK